MAAQSKEQSQTVKERAIAAFDIAGLKLPRNSSIRAALNPLKSKLSLGPNAQPYYLHNAAAILCAYGHQDRARDGALALGEVEPIGWTLHYNYIRSLTHAAYYFARRTGDDDGAAQLEPHLFKEGDRYDQVRVGSPGYPRRGEHPPASFMDGDWLARPFEDRKRWESSFLIPKTPEQLEKEIRYSVFGDIIRSATMWVHGGSELWPRERIDTYVDGLIPNLHALDGWAPGW